MTNKVLYVQYIKASEIISQPFRRAIRKSPWIMERLFSRRKAMENGNQYERVLKLFTQVMDLVMKGKRSLKVVADALQAILETNPRIIFIDRSTPFNPAKFIGKGWTIEEEDERALALTEVDISSVRLWSMLREGEPEIVGEDNLKRLKNAGHIRLDAKVFQMLWENQHLIPSSWKDKTYGDTTHIYFPGTVLRNPGGDRDVLCLCWDERGWYWGARWLGDDWYRCHPSALLASS